MSEISILICTLYDRFTLACTDLYAESVKTLQTFHLARAFIERTTLIGGFVSLSLSSNYCTYSLVVSNAVIKLITPALLENHSNCIDILKERSSSVAHG